MPVPSKLYLVARQAGVSRIRAEQLWVVAQRLSKQEGAGNRYALQLVRRMLEIEEIPQLVEKELARIREGLAGDVEVRAFFDSSNLCFATVGDVLIEQGRDPRIDLLCNIVNQHDWPESHDIWDVCENYRGSLQELFDRVLAVVGVQV